MLRERLHLLTEELVGDICIQDTLLIIMEFHSDIEPLPTSPPKRLYCDNRLNVVSEMPGQYLRPLGGTEVGYEVEID